MVDFVADSIVPVVDSPQNTVSSLCILLAAEPGVLSVCPGDEGNFPGHFGVVDPPAGLKAPSLSFSAGFLKVALALDCFNNSILGH